MVNRACGIVIRSLDYGEGSKIITVYTREAGKISLMARGAKKMNSRLAAATQLFACAEYHFYRSGGGKMGTLNHAEVTTSRQALREDVVLSAYGAYMLEMVDRLCAENESDPFVYDQLSAALDSLAGGKDAQIVAHLFEMKMLMQAGYTPNLQQCASCGGATGHPLLSARLGGLLCESCRGADQGAHMMTEQVLKLMRLFMKLDLQKLGQVDVRDETKQQLKAAMRNLLDTHIDVRWRSRRVMEQMEKYGF